MLIIPDFLLDGSGLSGIERHQCVMSWFTDAPLEAYSIEIIIIIRSIIAVSAFPPLSAAAHLFALINLQESSSVLASSSKATQSGSK